MRDADGGDDRGDEGIQVRSARIRSGGHGRSAAAPLAVACLVAVLSLASCARNQASAADFFSPVNRPSPAFSLVDQTGAPYSLAGQRGSVVVLNFMDTICTDACPISSAQFLILQNRLKESGDLGTRVRLVSVLLDQVDEGHFTYGDAARYAAAHDVDPAGWRLLTGTPEQVAAVAKDYGIAYHRQGGDLMHSVVTFVIDRDGRQRYVVPGLDFSVAELFQRVLDLANA